MGHYLSVKALVGIAAFLILCTVGCSARRPTLVYNERNFEALKKERHVVVEHITGRVQNFYRMEVVKTDDQYIYATCWKNKDSEPENFRFDKTEFVIKRSEDWHGSKWMTFFYSAGLTIAIVGLVYVLDRWL